MLNEGCKNWSEVITLICMMVPEYADACSCDSVTTRTASVQKCRRVPKPITGTISEVGAVAISDRSALDVSNEGAIGLYWSAELLKCDNTLVIITGDPRR